MKGSIIEMQSKIIFVIIFMLSFSVVHDSFISLLDKSGHKHIVYEMDDESLSSECNDFNEVHDMLHFVAIVDDYQSEHIEFVKRDSIPHVVIQYSPPLEKTSYKPPIA